MNHKRHAQPRMLAAVLLCSLAQIGCQRTEQPYTVTGGYTFSQDFDMERRVLRIQASSERSAACVQTRLPSETSVSWKRTLLDPTVHRALLGLLLDETRLPSYQADLEAAEESGKLICSPRPNEFDFCYTPEVVVTGNVPKVWVRIPGTDPPRLVGSPLRFGLQKHVALSREGRELIDAFLDAHKACWDPDD
ncbi:MAG: hypothetical protein HKN97_06665 [Myxococcales bacterium]|nr:hypothetical protein [Myxococcales bacterium]